MLLATFRSDYEYGILVRPNSLQEFANFWPSSCLLRSLSICPVWPTKKSSSGQFKWKAPRRARLHFPATTLQILALWPTGAGELNGSDPWAGPFSREPVLRTRAFHLSTDWSDRTDRTNGKRPKRLAEDLLVNMTSSDKVTSRTRSQTRLVLKSKGRFSRLHTPWCVGDTETVDTPYDWCRFVVFNKRRCELFPFVDRWANWSSRRTRQLGRRSSWTHSCLTRSHCCSLAPLGRASPHSPTTTSSGCPKRSKLFMELEFALGCTLS